MLDMPAAQTHSASAKFGSMNMLAMSVPPAWKLLSLRIHHSHALISSQTNNRVGSMRRARA